MHLLKWYKNVILHAWRAGIDGGHGYSHMTTPIMLQSTKFLSIQYNGYNTTSICEYLLALILYYYEFVFYINLKLCVQQLKLVMEFDFDLTTNVSFWQVALLFAFFC